MHIHRDRIPHTETVVPTSWRKTKSSLCWSIVFLFFNPVVLGCAFELSIASKSQQLSLQGVPQGSVRAPHIIFIFSLFLCYPSHTLNITVVSSCFSSSSFIEDNRKVFFPLLLSRIVKEFLVFIFILFFFVFFPPFLLLQIFGFSQWVKSCILKHKNVDKLQFGSLIVSRLMAINFNFLQK